MNYHARLAAFQKRMVDASIDLAFLPITADLQYLTGIPRDMPNFGATLYNGRWMEGAFIGREGSPVITLPRMTAEFREYRPWKTWAQFDKEISKYVGQPETDHLKQYVFIPPG